MESKKAKLIETVEWWLPGAEGLGKWGDIGQSSNKLGFRR